MRTWSRQIEFRNGSLNLVARPLVGPLVSTAMNAQIVKSHGVFLKRNLGKGGGVAIIKGLDGHKHTHRLVHEGKGLD